MNAWYIDSLDARGGIAFASYRAPDGPGFADAEQTVYVRPPYFVAEPIANRATALAARRGAFQSGYFRDGREVPFDSVAHVQEFVRRVFLGTGGTLDDGDGGGAALLPPPPPPEAPENVIIDLPSPPEGDGGDIAAMLSATFQEFRKLTDTLETAQQMDWVLLHTPQSPQALDVPLEAPAMRCARELLLRRPMTRSGSARWLQAWCALSYWARRVGVESRIFGDWFLHAPLPWHYQAGVWDAGFELLFGEAFEALRFLPIRQELAERLKISQDAPHQASIAALLTRICASPRIEPDISREVAELLLFGACAINTVNTLQLSALYVETLRLDQIGVTTFDPSDVMREQRVALVEAALAWCRSSLPRYAFPANIESTISDARSVRYAGKGSRTRVIGEASA